MAMTSSVKETSKICEELLFHIMDESPVHEIASLAKGKQVLLSQQVW